MKCLADVFRALMLMPLLFGCAEGGAGVDVMGPIDATGEVAPVQTAVVDSGPFVSDAADASSQIDAAEASQPADAFEDAIGIADGQSDVLSDVLPDGGGAVLSDALSDGGGDVLFDGSEVDMVTQDSGSVVAADAVFMGDGGDMVDAMQDAEPSADNLSSDAGGSGVDAGSVEDDVIADASVIAMDAQPEASDGGPVVSACTNVCGDLTQNGVADVNDIIYLVDVLAQGLDFSPCELADCDVLVDGKVDVNDAEMMSLKVAGFVVGGCEACTLSCGDLDGDGVIGDADLVALDQLIAQAMGLALCDFWAADVNGDSALDDVDRLRLQKAIEGTGALECL